MSTSYISRKNRFNNTTQFKESFSESSNPTVGYFFIGNSIPYENESLPIDIEDTVFDEKTVWNNMIAAKKIIGSDLELIIPKKIYANNCYYIQYDDKLSLNDLLISNTESQLYPFYVINNENHVYKCLSNNYGSISTIEPTGTGQGTAGVVTTTDSYDWQYMYTVPESNKFYTNNWIPVPINTNKLGYLENNFTPIDGGIFSISLENSGNNYFNGIIEVNPFTSSCTILTYSATTDVSNTISLNMEISGNGIQQGTYIQNIDLFNRYIYLSHPTISSGGSSGNNIQTLTRTIIVGDGFGAICNTVVANGSVTQIRVDNFGQEYNYASVLIYGTGQDASARAIISPKFGHGYNPAKELGCNTVMVVMNLNTSNNFSANTTFRQYGIMVDPYKYGETSPVTFSNSESTISQTTNVILLELNTEYELNELVYQGSSDNPTFSGIINEKVVNENKLKLIDVKGSITIGSVLKSNSEISGISVQDIEYPEFEPYSGDVLFVRNIEAIQRSEEQIENIKVIVQF